MKISAPDLNDPLTRAEVIIGILQKAEIADLKEFDRMMMVPAITPSLDMVAPKCRLLELVNPATGSMLGYAYYEGVGCILVFRTLHGGSDIWADALPGDGWAERQEYLAMLVKVAAPNVEVITQSGPDGKPVVRLDDVDPGLVN